MIVRNVAHQGTHLLVANGERHAVIERRAGVLAPDPSAIERVLDGRDSIKARGSGLSQRML
jgi:hypothetical protein